MTYFSSLLFWLSGLMIFVAYLIGSVSSAIILCKLLKLPDPRSSGSGNPGATNVLRIGGKKVALIVLLGDALKGFIPVIVAWLLHFDHSVIALTGLAAFLGHLYPIFFGFKGGKGVATCLGALFGLNLTLALIVIITWGIIFLVSRYSSLSALTGIFVGICSGWYFVNLDYYLVFIIMAVILFWRHRANIHRLLTGTESKFGKSR